MKVKMYTTVMLLVMMLATSGISAQPIVGYSGLFTFNTKYKITGIVTNASSGQPVEGAIVQTLFYCAQPTGQDGIYRIFVPPAYGYHVFAYAPGYALKELNGISVTAQNPTVIVNIQIDPQSGSYTVSDLTPNPNPDISEVMQGSTFHRYYEVRDPNSGLPAPGIPITVSGTNYVSDGKGIVDISIASSNIGNGQPGAVANFSITSVNGIPVSPAITFTGQVINKEYEKYWDNHFYSQLGVNFMGIDLSAESERGAITTLTEENGNLTDPDFLNIVRQGKAGIGVGFSVKSPSVKCQLGPVKAGVWAEAGLGVKFIGLTDDTYKFNHNIINSWQAMAEYILIADGNFKSIDNTMIRFLSLLEEYFTDQSVIADAFESDGVGLDVVGEASAEAFAGIEATKNLYLGAGANIGAEGHVTFNTVNHFKSSENEYNFGISGKFAGSAGAGIKLVLGDPKSKDELGAMLNIWDTELSRGLQFSVFKDQTSGQTTKFELTFISRDLFSNKKEEITYSISGEDAIAAISTLSDEIQQLTQFPQSGSLLSIANTTFEGIVNAVFNCIYNIQVNQSGDISISYDKNITNISHVSSFDLNMGLSITALAIKFGGEIGFEEGKVMTVEKGKWAFGQHFPNEKFEGTIPSIQHTYQGTLQEIINNVPLSIRTMMGVINFFLPGKSNNTFYVGNNGSYFVFGDNAIPSGVDSVSCSSWSWYGGAPSKGLVNLSSDKKGIFMKNKQKAEALYGMTYGIGGFYQFEPYGTNLLDTCWMTIVYNQEDADSIDESSLGMYWEDKSNHEWVFIGGIVDTANNTVTAPVQQLSLFTLAPAVPFGTFMLHSVPDSIYADSISIASITSDTIYNNNLQTITDGQLFTVKTSAGKIISADADTILEGVQVVASGRKIQFQVRSSIIAGNATVSAYSVQGSANATTQVKFYDTIPPAVPVLSVVSSRDEGAEIHWARNNDIDLAGYILYYDTDTIPPFEGIHTVYGTASPLILGTDTTVSLIGFLNDSTYYFFLTAYDVAGNESDYSQTLSTIPKATSSLTLKLFLEGLYNPGLDAMNKSQDEFGDHFTGNIADQVTVELHNATNYSVIEYSVSNVNLSANGTITINTIPKTYNGSYYITLRHRNSIETTTALPVSFASGIVNYDFTTAASKAYGDNQHELDGVFTFWCGDVNQDGIVDGSDMNLVDNALTAITFGYVSEDSNGDGIVDGGDMNIVDNNTTAIIMAIVP